jgi:hypothetical protein
MPERKITIFAITIFAITNVASTGDALPVAEVVPGRYIPWR